MYKIYYYCPPKCNPRSVYRPRTVFWRQNAHIHFDNLVFICTNNLPEKTVTLRLFHLHCSTYYKPFYHLKKSLNNWVVNFAQINQPKNIYIPDIILSI